MRHAGLGHDGAPANDWVTPERVGRPKSAGLKGEILPDDVAAMVLFLASGSARMCTGQNFIVDAGVV